MDSAVEGCKLMRLPTAATAAARLPCCWLTGAAAPSLRSLHAPGCLLTDCMEVTPPSRTPKPQVASSQANHRSTLQWWRRRQAGGGELSSGCGLRQ